MTKKIYEEPLKDWEEKQWVTYAKVLANSYLILEVNVGTHHYHVHHGVKTLYLGPDRALAVAAFNRVVEFFN
jgi:hypothetical protein